MTLKGMGLVVTAVLLAACSPKGEALYNRAEKSLTAGEVNAAVIDLKNLVKAEPANAKARALLAAALVQGGDIGGAAIEIQKAKDLGASAESLLVPECRVMVAQGEFAATLEKCKPDAATGNVKFQMQLAQGQALLGLQRAAEARTQFEAALATEPGSLEALLGLAGATYEMDGLPAALAVLGKADPDIQKQTAYWMAVGGLNAQGGDLVAAEAAYQKALASLGKRAEDGERLMALGALAEVQMRQGKFDDADKSTEQMVEAAPNNPMVKQLRGQVAAAGGRLDEARTYLEEAVAAMPENYQARTLLGMVNMRQGNLGQAEMHFQQVLANQPDNARVQRLLVEARAQLQTPEETLEALGPTLASGDADPTMLAMAGRLSLAAGNREQALAYFAQASSQPGAGQPSDVQLEVASGHLAAGDVDRAIELLEKMPAGGATGLQREYLLLAALLQKGETGKAVAEANRLVEQQGSDVQVRNLAAGVYAAVGQNAEARKQFGAALKIKPDDATTLINLARLDLSEGKTKEAEKWLTKASTAHPESIEAQLALVQFYLGTREFAKADKVIDAAAQKAPSNAAVSNARGLAKMGLNDVPAAIASFRQATSQAPKAYGYSLNLARAHVANRDVASALAVLDGVLKVEPKYAPALSLAAATSLQSGQAEKATGYIERLRQAQPEAPGTYLLEGHLAMTQKRYKDALGFYRKAGAQGSNAQLVLAEYRAASLAGESRPVKVLEDWVAKNPNDPVVVPVLAEHRMASGDADGAIVLYERVLAGNPTNAVVLNNLAMLYSAKGSDKALALAEQAYQAAPDAAAVQDTYGWVLFRSGQTDKGLEMLRKAAQSLGNNAEVQYHLGAALVSAGKDAEAAEWLQKAVAGQLPADQKAAAQKLLDQVKQ